MKHLVVTQGAGEGRFFWGPSGFGQTGTTRFFAPAFSNNLPGLVPTGTNAGKFLKDDGTWDTPAGGGGGGGTPGAPTGGIQFNFGSGVFGGSSGFMFWPGSGMHLAGQFRMPTGTISLGATGPNNAPVAHMHAASGMFHIVLGSSANDTGVLLDNPSAEGLGSNLRFRSFDLHGLGKPREWLGIDRGLGGATGALDVYLGHPTESRDTTVRAMDRVRLEVSPTGTIDSRIENRVGFRVSASGVFAPSGMLNIGALPLRQPTLIQGTFFRDDGEWISPSGAHQFPPAAGVTNNQLATVASGTVKGSLTSASPSDIPIPTLAAFLPTFTAARAGLVPVSGGGTDNFLRADGAFAIPPGSGASPSGLSLAQLAPINSPRIVGRISTGSGVPEEIIPTLIATLLPHFTDTGRGMVPASAGGTTTYLRADTTFAAPSGAHQFPPAAGATNEQLASVPSGTVKGRLTTGVPTDILIPTLAAFFPTFTSSRAGLVPTSDGDTAKYLRADAAFSAPSGAHQFPPAAGVANAQLAVMASGTVKANLTGNAVPSDVLIPTLMVHFPTFTSARPGLVPLSGGGTDNFLRADGAFAVPPGGAASPGGALGNFQFHNGVGFGGASGINVAASGLALAFGPLAANQGDIRVGSGFSIVGRNPSGIAQPLLEHLSATGTLKLGGSGLPRLLHEAASGGVHEFGFGGATATTARLLPTGIDLTGFHIKAKSIDVDHINGLPANANALKRGNNIFLASGLSLYLPRISATGANRFIVPSGAVGTNMSVILQPSGGKGGNVIRIERVDSSAGQIDVKTPTGTILYSMPSGTKHWADFMFTKPSGTAFEHAGAADMF